MEAFLQFWDRVELWLVTLPFVLQLSVMLVVGVPVFASVAVLVDLVADRVVGAARRLVGVRAVRSTEEVR